MCTFYGKQTQVYVYPLCIRIKHWLRIEVVTWGPCSNIQGASGWEDSSEREVWWMWEWDEGWVRLNHDS